MAERDIEEVSEGLFAGSLIGQCLGDALGFVVEGEPPNACRRYVEDTLRAGRVRKPGPRRVRFRPVLRRLAARPRAAPELRRRGRFRPRRLRGAGRGHLQRGPDRRLRAVDAGGGETPHAGRTLAGGRYSSPGGRQRQRDARRSCGVAVQGRPAGSDSSGPGAGRDHPPGPALFGRGRRRSRRCCAGSARRKHRHRRLHRPTRRMDRGDRTVPLRPP